MRITRRQILKTGIAGAAAGAAALSVPAFNYLTRRDPTHSVVFILLDTLKAGHLGCYGYGRDTSPNIDALAKQSAVYLRNKSQSTLTAPSMASLFSSRLLLNHFIPDIVPSFPEVLQRAGYRTIAIQTNPWLDEKRRFTRGFEVYRTLLPKGEDAGLEDWETRAADSNVFYADAEAVFDAAREAIEALDGKRPFFLYAHLMDVHGPYIPGPEHDVFSTVKWTFGEQVKMSGDFVRTSGRELEATIARLKDDIIALYDGEIREADHFVGNLIGLLREKGLYEDSFIVVASDHGEHFGEHGRVQHGNSVYEELLHTPLIVKNPGQAAKEEVDFLTSNVDIAPTAIAGAGFDRRRLRRMGWRGRVLGDVTGGGTEMARAALLAHAFRDGYASVEKDGWKLIDETAKSESGEVTERVMLFNLWKDPKEATDLSATNAEMLRQLAAELKGHRGQGLRTAQIEKPVSPEEEKRLKALGYLQ